ncbi:hypothetical protein ACFWVC_18700 [Streptomyces sp. NPDC058691]|uniref:hypothetical protein n=1 Tax=Streptomyces sp. NPDC058691 TaxID=3346601 RepID=UPI00364EAABA
MIDPEGRQGGTVETFDLEYRMRRKVPRRWLVTVSLAFLPLVIDLTRPSATRWPWYLTVSLVAFVLLVLIRTVLYFARGYTRVGHGGIATRGALRDRLHAWSDLHDIRVEENENAGRRSAPKWWMYVYRTDGRRFALPHVTDWQVDDAAGELAAIRALGEGYRGIPWTADPRVEARIGHRAARRKAWERGVVAGLIAFGCVCSFVVVRLVAGARPSLWLLAWVPLGTLAVVTALLHWACRRREARSV